MSIAINFGSAPEEIHWFGGVAPEIWDIIYTFKENAEERDFIQPIVDKFKKIPHRALGIGTSWATGGLEYEQKEYCRENKIKMSYNGKCYGSDDDVMVVAIVFHLFHRKMPSARNLPVGWKKKGLRWKIVEECWEQEDQNLFLIAKAFTGGVVSYRDGLEGHLEWWKQEGIEYTGCPECIQRGIDRRKEVRSCGDYAAYLRER